MSRDPAGQYSKPFPDVVPDTTIESAEYNGTIDDLVQDANFARPIVAGGTGANSAAAARDNLDAERAMQTVTNFDSHVFETGSFLSAGSATNPPVAAHAFVGAAFVSDANNIVVKAYDLNDTIVPGRTYAREKKAGVWTAWGLDQSGAFVSKTGDTMSGNLTITKASPDLVLNKTAGAARLIGQLNGSGRWIVYLGDGTAEGGGNTGSDYYVQRFNDAGVAIDQPIKILRSTGLMELIGNPTVPLGAATKQYVDLGDTNLANIKVAKAGDTMTGDLTIAKSRPLLTLNKNAADNLSAFIAGQKNGLNRWTLELGDAVAESGGNAGTEFMLSRWNDAGTFLGAPLTINRSNGAAAFDGYSFKVKGNAGFTWLQMDSPPGQPNWFIGSKNGSFRWQIDFGDGAAESGGNAGSNINFQRFNDAGAYIGPVLTLNRATANAQFSGMVDAQGLIMGRAGIGGATSYQHSFTWASPNLSAYIQNSNIGVVQIVSDYRVKDNVAALPSMWDVVSALRPISYTVKDWTPPWEVEEQKKNGNGEFSKRDDRTRWGFIAHELQEALLETAATGHKDCEGTIQSPDPWPVIAALTKVVQELQARVEALEASHA